MASLDPFGNSNPFGNRTPLEAGFRMPGDLAEEDVTDGHIDGLACFARPGLILLETARDLEDPRYRILQENRRALEGATDARGRPIEIVPIEEAWEVEGA